jgi:hypothetical protein
MTNPVLLGGYPATNSHQATNFKQFYDAVVPSNQPQIRVERIYIGRTNSTGPQFITDIGPAIAGGRTPIISFKFNVSWTNIANGAEDSRFDAIFNTGPSGILGYNISGLAMPPRICFHHEPESDDTVQNFNAMQMHLVERYKTVIRANGWDLCYIMTGGIFRNQSSFWPLNTLDTAVAGVDIHRMYADPYMKPGGGPYSVGSWVDPNSTSTVFRAHRDWCNARGMTAAWPEYGVLQQEGDTDGSFQADFINATVNLSWLRELEFIIYYDRVLGEGGSTSYASITHGGTLAGPSTLALTAFSHLGLPGSGPPPTGPTITSFTPTTGASGTIVTITGTNFTGATSVRFGTLATTFTVVSSTTITAAVPPNAVTSGIVVTTSAGSVTSSSPFTIAGTPPNDFTPGVVPPMTRVRQAG